MVDYRTLLVGGAGLLGAAIPILSVAESAEDAAEEVVRRLEQAGFNSVTMNTLGSQAVVDFRVPRPHPLAEERYISSGMRIDDSGEFNSMTLRYPTVPGPRELDVNVEEYVANQVVDDPSFENLSVPGTVEKVVAYEGYVPALGREDRLVFETMQAEMGRNIHVLYGIVEYYDGETVPDPAKAVELASQLSQAFSRALERA